MEFNKVTVMGLGYVGLPTAAIIATRGIDVIGVDVHQHVVDTINEGNIHIVEPDLDIAVRSSVMTGKLKASLTAEPSDVFLIAVPTPFKKGTHNKEITSSNGETTHYPVPDLSYIESACKALASVLEKGNLVILESTSPVGTTEKVAEWLAKERPDLSFPQQAGETADIHIAHCPERVLPGYVLQELISNDRIIGGLTKTCADHAQLFYERFVKGECITTHARTAEMAKLTENSFRDVNIAFANELSIICERIHVNVWELIKLSNRHPRVNILTPGPGVGGHCIAVDPWFIVDSAPEEARLIATARQVNDGKPLHIIEKVKEAADQFKQPVIACFGLSYKADIDDLRESPALDITMELAKANVGTVLAVEPNIKTLPPKFDGLDIELVDTNTALEKANTIVLLVDHKDFKKVPMSDLSSKVVIDSRGIWY